MSNAAENLDMSLDGGAAVQAVDSDKSQMKEISGVDFNKSGDTISKIILSLVIDDRFDSAMNEIQYYQQLKAKTPLFAGKTNSHFRSAVAIIRDIREKRNIPNFDRLRSGKQKEVRDQVIKQVKHLKDILTKIEQVDHDLKIQDVRSTVWVLKTFTFCSVTLVFFVAIYEAVQILNSPVKAVVVQVMNLLFYSNL